MILELILFYFVDHGLEHYLFNFFEPEGNCLLWAIKLFFDVMWAGIFLLRLTIFF